MLLDLAWPAQQTDRDLQAGAHHRCDDDRAGKAREHLLDYPPGLAPLQTACLAARKEHRGADWGCWQSARGRRYPIDGFDRPVEALARHRWRDDKTKAVVG